MAIDAAHLPTRALRSGSVAYRLFRRFGPDGSVRGPWFFSSSGSSSSGRFDLPTPRGTCYFASTAIGAWLEVFGSVRVVDPSDVRRRALARAVRSGGDLRLVDLASRRAAVAGASLDLTAGDDYSAAQEVARQADARGAAGIRALLRRDPSGSSHNLALFGVAGAPSRQFGWRVTKTEPWRDAPLMRELADLGVRVIDIPHDLQVTPVRARRRPRTGKRSGDGPRRGR